MSIHSTGLGRDGVAAVIAVKPKRAAEMLGTSVSRLYELMASGEIASFKDGYSRKVVVASMHDYVARCAALGTQLRQSAAA